MARLNKDLREKIVEDLMEHRFAAQIKGLVQQRADLANDIWNASFTKDKLNLMDSLPEGWLPEGSAFHVSLGGTMREFNFSGNTAYSYYDGNSEVQGVPQEFRKRLDNVADTVYKRMPRKNQVPHGGGNPIAVYDGVSEYSLRLDAWVSVAKELGDLYVAALRAVRTSLDDFNDTKRLFEAWPEVKPFVLPHLTADEQRRATALALPAADMNAIFGLPVEDANGNDR